MPQPDKLSLLQQLLESAENAISGAQKIIADLVGEPSTASKPKRKSAKTKELPLDEEVDGKVIEGVFDGQNMIGKDGKTYSVPANYASKSKLVEGDTLKLTISADGTFIYKQIGPVDRKRVIGRLVRDEATDEFVVDVKGARYKLLRASITYFKGNENDEVVVLLPKNAESTWAAVENIIRSAQDRSMAELLENETADDL